MLGASGGIGQPLALLLKNSPLVSRLTLYDIAHTPGVAADLSHIETRATVKGNQTRCAWRLCSPSPQQTRVQVIGHGSSVEVDQRLSFHVHHGVEFTNDYVFLYLSL